MKYHFAYLI